MCHVFCGTIASQRNHCKWLAPHQLPLLVQPLPVLQAAPRCHLPSAARPTAALVCRRRPHGGPPCRRCPRCPRAAYPGRQRVGWQCCSCWASITSCLRAARPARKSWGIPAPALPPPHHPQPVDAPPLMSCLQRGCAWQSRIRAAPGPTPEVSGPARSQSCCVRWHGSLTWPSASSRLMRLTFTALPCTPIS